MTEGGAGAVAKNSSSSVQGQGEADKTVYRFLIDEGYFAITRNPNYLGEMLLYGSFASLCPRYEPWVVLAFVWGTVFQTFMREKDASLRSKARRSVNNPGGFEEYHSKSGLLLPRLSSLLLLWGAAKKMKVKAKGA